MSNDPTTELISQDLLDRQDLMEMPNLDCPEFQARAVAGFRTDCAQRLFGYLATLKTVGCGMKAAAARARISYPTVQKARERSIEFRMLEEAALNEPLADVEGALLTEAKTGTTSAIALFLKHRGEYVDKIEITATNELPAEAYSAETRKMMLKDQLSFAAKVKSNGKVR